MTTNENTAAKLPRGWRTYSTDDLQVLADTLQQEGAWPEYEDVQGELELREDEAELFGHPDSPSLGDMGLHLGSYAS